MQIERERAKKINNNNTLKMGENGALLLLTSTISPFLPFTLFR